MHQFEGRNCFITGGAHGIGKELVSEFARAGAKVSFCDTDQRAGRELADRYGNVYFYPADVREEAELVRVFREAAGGGVTDILVNNVGVGNFAPITETTVGDFANILKINLRPVFILSREMALQRREKGTDRRGAIVNISSTRYLQSEPGTEGYAASKGGIVSLTHALAVSLAEYRITVNCISPGWIETKNYDELSAGDHEQHPSGRVGRPDDIARLCLFLADERNDFINGQNFTADGGMTKKMIYRE